MAKYRKKHLIIEAEQFFQDQYDAINYLPEGACDCRQIGDKKYTVHCHTLEGPVAVLHFDWIIRDIHGEYRRCKPNIFEATYELVKESSGKCTG